jgi:flagellum-specific peptidoglycan hydrolase FlgJ
MMVKKTVTTASNDEFVAAVYRHWSYSQGRPSLLTAAILLAQYAFETGWGQYCFCWNLGNVRAFEPYIASGKNYFILPSAWEMIEGKRMVVGGAFRAHASLDEGMHAHLAFLSGLDRYEKAFEVLIEAASLPFTKENARLLARRFVLALKAGGYFTGDVTEYVTGVTSIVVALVTSLHVDEMPDTVRSPAEVLGPDPEFAGWGATTVDDIFARWVYDECMSADFLNCRWDGAA